MNIKNLEKMEKIVKKYPNLHWVGWDIADRKRTEAGRTAINGVRVDGQWYVQNMYRVNRNGWDIPNRYKL